MGVGVGSWVGQAAMLREGHCKRNESYIGGQRHENVLSLKSIVHIRAIFARLSREWELHVNAKEPCVPDMRICTRILKKFCECKRR